MFLPLVGLQIASVAELLMSFVCALTSGDGGNDVSMIQEADCGVGVEGKVRLPCV